MKTFKKIMKILGIILKSIFIMFLIFIIAGEPIEFTFAIFLQKITAIVIVAILIEKNNKK